MKKNAPRPLLLFVFCALLATSGCATTLIAGSTTGAVIANDNRTPGAFIEDEGIELKIELELYKKYGTGIHVSAISYDRNVLLVGQAPDEKIIKNVENIAKAQANVKKVINRIDLAAPSSVTARLSDAAITGKVKAALCGLQVEGFSCLDVKVVTENGVVYLLGLVGQKVADQAVATTRATKGVLQVVKMFSYR